LGFGATRPGASLRCGGGLCGEGFSLAGVHLGGGRMAFPP